MAHWLGHQKRSSYFHGAAGTVQPLSAAELALTRRAYYGRNYDRLVEIKTQYDPANRFRPAQGIRPA